MANPVVTVTIDKVHVVGDRKHNACTVTFDTGNYVTGGVPVTAANFGLVQLTGLQILGSSVHVGEYDHIAGTIRLRVAATGAEVGSGVALTASSSLRVRAVGY